MYCRALPTLGPFSLENESQKADNVNATVKGTLDTMSQLGVDLAKGKEWAQSLPKLADEGQKMTSNVDNLGEMFCMMLVCLLNSFIDL